MDSNTPTTPTTNAPMTMPKRPAKTGRRLEHDNDSTVVKKLAFPDTTPSTPTTTTITIMPGRPLKIGRRAMGHGVHTSTVAQQIQF